MLEQNCYVKNRKQLLFWREFRSKIRKRVLMPSGFLSKNGGVVQVNNYKIIVRFYYISHNLTRYSVIVHKFTRIYPVCSTYELTKQFVQICVKNCTTDLKKNNLYKSLDRTPLNFSILGTSLLKLVRTFYL